MAALDFGKAPVDPRFWYLEAGLYHTEDYRFKDYNSHGWGSFRENLLAIIYPKITIDVYCTRCERETVFAPARRAVEWVNEKGQEIVRWGVEYAHFQCSRGDCKSDLYFVFDLNRGLVTKIGQYPSIADLLKPELRKYRPVLDADLLADWQRAVGLRAHGIGAGSYVYLRRIIEKMILAAFAAAESEGKVSKEQFERSRWSERIKLLTAYLPAYLVENAPVYSVLSKGVHELSEEECADYFDVMHTSIEVICDEKLAELQKREKSQAGSKALQKVLQKLAGSEVKE